MKATTTSKNEVLQFALDDECDEQTSTTVRPELLLQKKSNTEEKSQYRRNEKRSILRHIGWTGILFIYVFSAKFVATTNTVRNLSLVVFSDVITNDSTFLRGYRINQVLKQDFKFVRSNDAQQVHEGHNEQSSSSDADVINQTDRSNEASRNKIDDEDTSVQGSSHTVDYKQEVVSADNFNEIETAKPRFVIHMGPLKTGTTTLQGDLAEMVWGTRSLQTDEWNYLNVHNIHEDGTVVSPDLSRIRFEDPKYFELFKKEVKRLRTFNQNMVYVEEGFSVVFGDHPEYFDKLKDIFADEWDVTIVLGYRPYFDWIPSTWYQAMRRNDWVYKDPATWPWKDQDGNFYYIQTMFPEFYSWMSEIKQFTDSIKEFASRHFDVTVMDLDDERGLRSIFFCDILKAENTCEEIRRLDAEGGVEVVNRGSLDIIHYDSISLAAASKGLVDVQKWNRIDILNAIQRQVEEVLHQSAKDLPMICPDEETMTDLLEKSLTLDSLSLPEKNISDPDRKTKLRERFRINLEDKKTFCSIDKDALISRSEWMEFFQQFQ